MAIQFKTLPLNDLMTPKAIIQLLKSDTEAYQEDLDIIAKTPDYWTANDNDNQRYWTAWFNASDMQEWSY